MDEKFSWNEAVKFLKVHSDLIVDYLKSLPTGRNRIDQVTFDWEKKANFVDANEGASQLYRSLHVYCYVNDRKEEEVCLWVIEKKRNCFLSIEGIGIAEAKINFRKKYLDGNYELYTGEVIA